MGGGWEDPPASAAPLLCACLGMGALGTWVPQDLKVEVALPLLDTFLPCLLPPRRPKLEKKDTKEVASATQSPVSMKRKKKGFLPETKKRKKRKSEDATAEATSENQPPSTGKKRRRKIKAKTPELQNKSEKLSQVNGVTPTSPAEPVGKKQHQKALPKKGVSGKSPQSALPRKKARLSLVRSPSLFQSGAKRKRMRKKGQAPQAPACPSAPASRSPADS